MTGSGGAPARQSPGSGLPRRFSVSTGCVASLLRDLNADEVVRVVDGLGAPGLEVLLVSRWMDALDEAAEIFTRVQAPVLTVHGEKRIGGLFGHSDPEQRALGIEHFKRSVDFAAAVGAEFLNFHLWDLPDSDDNLDRNLETYERVRDYARERGVRPLVEVVPCRRNTALENMRRVVEALGDEAAFTIDFEFLSWAAPIEEQIVEIAARYGPRILNLHVRDYDGSPFTDEGRRHYVRPGHGRIPFDAVAAALDCHPAPRIITLEAAYRGPDWAELVQTDLDFVRRWFS